MSVEAEQKAYLRDPDAVRAALDRYGPPRHSVYRDTYYDSPDGSLVARGHELRVRIVDTGDSCTTLLTAKGGVVDAALGSKQESETEVADAQAIRAVLEQLGYRVYVELTKRCSNVDLETHGYSMLATVVTVPEVDGMFIELETVIASGADIDAAMSAVHAVLTELGVDPGDHTDATYTDAVIAARAP